MDAASCWPGVARVLSAPTDAIITLGLTHATTRSGVVAVDVTDPTAPVQVAHTETECKCTEGVAIIPSAQVFISTTRTPTQVIGRGRCIVNLQVR